MARPDDERIGHVLSRVILGEISQHDASKELGISQAAVCKRLKNIRGRSTYAAITSEKVDQIIDGNVNIVQQLNKINVYANKLLNNLMTTIGEIIDPEAIDEKPTSPEAIDKKRRADTQVAVKIMSEIRSQLQLMMNIYEMLYSLEGAAQFQQTVLEVLESCDPKLRKEVMSELNKKHALRAALRF